MFRLLPDISLGFEAGLAARTPQPRARQESSTCEAQQHKDQRAAAQAAMSNNRSKAESVAFARLSAEFRLFAGSDQNARSLVIGLRDGTGITLTECINGSSSEISFTPPTGHMGYSNVSIALSLARQDLAAHGVGQPTIQQLQAALIGGTITVPLSGNAIRLHGILPLKLQGMGWGKIAGLLGIKLGSVIGEARPIPAVLPSRANKYSCRVSRAAPSNDSIAKPARS